MSIDLLFTKTPSLAEPAYFWGGSSHLQTEFDVWSRKRRKKTNIVRWLQKVKVRSESLGSHSKERTQAFEFVVTLRLLEDDDFVAFLSARNGASQYCYSASDNDDFDS